MFGREKFEPQSDFLKKMRKEREDKERDSRRKFIKNMGIAGLGLILAKAGYGIKEKVDLFMESNGYEEEKPTPEQEEIDREDGEVIGQTIEEQLKTKKEISLNKETKKAIYERWRRNYSPGGKDHLGMIQGLERMEPWLLEMKKQFREVGLPEEYVYLSIPESHFIINAKSTKDAKGPFQFTHPTASDYELKIGGGIDERLDPIKSARACARLLKDNYQRLNHDWKLAFAAYNGGFVNDYAKERNMKNRNYEDYLAWREKRMNDYLRKHNFSFSQKMKNMSESLENLNYPEKFYAVLDVIRENNLNKKYNGEVLKCDLIETPKTKTSHFSATAGKGEGLLALARKIHTQAKKANPKFSHSILQVEKIIEVQNRIKNSKNIKLGQKIKVELPMESGSSLSRIAQIKGISLKEIQKLNPAVLDASTSIPERIKIRIPKA